MSGLEEYDEQGRATDGSNLIAVVAAYPRLVEELIKLMLTEADASWLPDTKVCRWCHCHLLRRSGTKPPEEHAPDCFAVKYLGRPSR